MTDCLIIGFNDSSFEEYVQMVKSMGADGGAYRDLRLAFVNYQDKPFRSMDLLNHFYYEGKSGPRRIFHNADFLWPAVTYLATYLHRRGMTFDYVNLFHLEREKLIERLRKNDILTIAITTTLYVSPHPILEIISTIRRYNTTAKIIVGGPYISNQQKMIDTLSLNRLFNYMGADFYVVNSEGEYALANLIKALKTHSSLDGIDNIAYKAGRSYVTTKLCAESNPLEDNMVDYALFPKEELREFVTLRTAKSCPFECAFCGFPERAGKYTYMSVEHVKRELDALRDLGVVTTLTFIDDTFNVPKGRFKDLLRMMIKENYGFKWNCFYRSDHGDEEAIELMGKAGCEGVFLGVESGSDTMLEAMKKSARRHHYMTAVPLLRSAGISSYASLIIGFPGETLDTVQETLAFIEEAKPDFVRAQLWYADPITPVWNDRRKYGITGSAFSWSHNTMDSQTACDMVDRFFLQVQNSIWLPQFGFEQWSTFYLQRMGMTLGRIKDFLKCFNAMVKEQLLYPHKKEPSPDLVASLDRSCRGYENGRPDMSPVEKLCGAKYQEAEQFWVDEFKTGAPPPLIGAWRGQDDENGGRPRLACVLDRAIIGRIQALYGADLSEVLLLTYALLLSRLIGREETMIVAVIATGGHASATPVKSIVYWNLCFSEFLDLNRPKLRRSIEHAIYGFHFLAGAQRAAARPSPGSIDVGYLFCDVESMGGRVGFADALDSRSVSGEAGLVLSVFQESDKVRLELSADSEKFSQAAVAALGAHLVSTLQEISQCANVSLGDLLIESRELVRNFLVDTDAGASFNFGVVEN